MCHPRVTRRAQTFPHEVRSACPLLLLGGLHDPLREIILPRELQRPAEGVRPARAARHEPIHAHRPRLHRRLGRSPQVRQLFPQRRTHLQDAERQRSARRRLRHQRAPAHAPTAAPQRSYRSATIQMQMKNHPNL